MAYEISASHCRPYQNMLQGLGWTPIMPRSKRDEALALHNATYRIDITYKVIRGTLVFATEADYLMYLLRWS